MFKDSSWKLLIPQNRPRSFLAPLTSKCTRVLRTTLLEHYPPSQDKLEDSSQAARSKQPAEPKRHGRGPRDSLPTGNAELPLLHISQSLWKRKLENQLLILMGRDFESHRLINVPRAQTYSDRQTQSVIFTSLENVSKCPFSMNSIFLILSTDSDSNLDHFHTLDSSRMLRELISYAEFIYLNISQICMFGPKIS